MSPDECLSALSSAIQAVGRSQDRQGGLPGGSRSDPFQVDLVGWMLKEDMGQFAQLDVNAVYLKEGDWHKITFQT